MGADTDPDIQAQIAAALAASKPAAPANAAAPTTAASSGGADIDPAVMAQVHAQLTAPTATPASSAPAAILPQGETAMGSSPERHWYSPINDAVDMMVNGLPFSDRITAGMQTATGTGLPNADYSKNLLNEHLKNQALESEYPTLSKILGFGGGAAGIAATAPESATLGAGTMLGKTLGSMAAGAGYGGVQGAASAPDLTDTADLAKRTATGASVGGLTGALTPVVGSVIGSGYNAGANLLNGGVEGMSRPTASQLLRAVAADTPTAVQATNARLGDQGMLADAGPALRAKTQGAAIYNPEGRSIVENALTARDAETNSGLKQDIVSAVGPVTATPQQLTDYVKQARSWEHQALPGIFANAAPVDTSGVLTTIGQGLTKAVGPEASILGQARNYLMRQGKDANGNPIPVPVTDAETLQNAKIAIDKLIDYGDPSLGIQPGAVSKAQGAIGAVRGQLNQALRDQVPGYGDVMDTSSALARHADAIESGYNDVLGGGKSALNPADLADKLAAAAKQGPEVASGYQLGLRAAIDRATGTNPNDLVALRRLIGGDDDWNRANMSHIMGAGPTNQMADAIDKYSTMRDTKNQILSGAKTAWANQALNEMKPNAGTDHVPFFTPQSNLTGMLSTMAAWPVKTAWGAIQNQFKTDPSAYHGEMARVLTAQGPQRDAYTSALVDALMRRAGNAATGQRIGNQAALASALIGGQYANGRLLPPQ